ncbi:MAG: hypothetical protein RRX92_01705 [Lachnospiraceae bacterium]
MMYIHYCANCSRIHMMNGHKIYCPKCKNVLTELRVTYMDYVTMSDADRINILEQCADPQQLKEIRTKYRMYKYSKWYKELNAEEQLALQKKLQG